MHRVLGDGPFEAGGSVSIPDEEVHHLRVRRAAAGDPVEVLDGRGAVARGTLAPAERGWIARIDSVATIPPPVDLILIVGAGDRDRFGWLVEKAAELGVTALVPIETERSRNVATRIRAEHLDKLRRRAAEALKQAGGGWLTQVRPIVALAAAVAAERPGRRWLADPAGRGPPGEDARGPISIAVGPEGGFTDAERTLLIDRGFHPVRLGSNILRFETAALAAAAIVSSSREAGR